MTDTPIQVHPDEVHGVGHRLADTAHRIAAAVPQSPPLVVVADPLWAATVALEQMERAAGALFGALGADAALLAGRLRAAAAGYEAADERSARRFTGRR